MPHPTTSVQVGPAPARGLPERVVGVLLSPRNTYADVVAHPQWRAVLLLAIVIPALARGLFLSTELGQVLWLDQQIRVLESFGVGVTDWLFEQMQAHLAQSAYGVTAGHMLLVPVLAVVLAAIGVAVFNLATGRRATFKQVFALVVHSQLIGALTVAVAMPLSYGRQAMSNPANLTVFLPMLDDTTLLGRLLGWVDLFRIWWLLNLSIGLGVLYKLKTRPVAIGLLGAYAAMALVIAAVMRVRAGA